MCNSEQRKLDAIKARPADSNSRWPPREMSAMPAEAAGYYRLLVRATNRGRTKCACPLKNGRRFFVRGKFHFPLPRATMEATILDGPLNVLATRPEFTCRNGGVNLAELYEWGEAVKVRTEQCLATCRAMLQSSRDIDSARQQMVSHDGASANGRYGT